MFSMLPRSTSFDDLLSKLLFYEQPLNYKKESNLSIHQAFVATSRNVDNQGSAKVNGNNKGNRNKGNRGRNNQNNEIASQSNAQSQQTSSSSMLADIVLRDAVVLSFGATSTHSLILLLLIILRQEQTKLREF